MWGPLTYSIIASAKGDTLTSSFAIFIILISFCCIIALARNFITILNKQGESRQHFVFPYISGFASGFSLFSLMLAVILLYITFIMFGYVPEIAGISKTLTWRCVELCHRQLQHLMRWPSGFFLEFITWCIMLMNFHILNFPASLGWSLLVNGEW